jgi:DNA modification methylase
MKNNWVLYGKVEDVIPVLPSVNMVFADPPDNLGLKYDGYEDKLSDDEYIKKLKQWVDLAVQKSPIVWFSIYHKYLPEFLFYCKGLGDIKLFIWRFTFGQHQDKDCGNGYRPIIRLTHKDAILYPDSIREPSRRQTLYNDKRANPNGRVPDDVWDFSRICGTFKERRQWHPTQHPEGLIARIIKFSTKEEDTVIDMFSGTGTTNRVCKKLKRNCYGIEQSKFYCDKVNDEELS